MLPMYPERSPRMVVLVGIVAADDGRTGAEEAEAFGKLEDRGAGL
jgi:hypothetical protein